MRLIKVCSQYQQGLSVLLLTSLLLQSCGNNELLGDPRHGMREQKEDSADHAGGLVPQSEGILSREDPAVGASHSSTQTVPAAHAGRPPLPPSGRRKRRHIGTGSDEKEEESAQASVSVTSKRKVAVNRGECKKRAVKKTSAASMSAQRRLRPPSLPPDHISRVEAQKGLSAHLERSGCCVLTGPSGVGKSTLASAYAHHQLKSKPVYWLKAQTDSQLLDELEHLATALDIHYHSLSQKHRQDPLSYVQLLIEQIYPKLRGAPTLLVIDNVSASSQAHVSLILKHRPASVQVLVTMYGLSPCPDHAIPMLLPGFSDQEAATYLRCRFSSMGRPLEASLPTRLMSELRLSPHSLGLACGYLACHGHQSVGGYLERLQALQQSKASTDESLLESQVELALEGLAASAQQLLRYSAYLSTEMIPRELLTSLVGDQAERCLDQLSRLSLLRVVSDADDADKVVGIQVPPLVQQACRHYRGWQGAGAMEERALLEQLVEVLLRSLPELEGLSHTWQEACFVYVPHVVSVVRASASVLGPSEGLACLLLRAGNYKERVQGNFAEGLAYKKEGLSVLQALYPSQAHGVVVRALSSVGVSHEELGHVLQGLDYLTQALAMWQSLHGGVPHPDVAHALHRVGLAHERLGNAVQGLASLEQALAMLQSLHGEAPHPDVARVLLSLGVCHQQLGNGQQSLAYFEKSLVMLQALHGGSDHADVARALHNVGLAHQKLGNRDQGVDYLAKSLFMLQSLHSGTNHCEVARALLSLGKACEQLGNALQGLRYREQSLQMLQELHAGQNHPEVAEALSSVGLAYGQLGHAFQGLSYQQAGLSMWRLLYPGQSHPDVARSLLSMGTAYSQLGEARQGLSCLEEGLSMLRVLHEGEAHPEVARALHKVGLLHQELGEFRAGLSCLEEGLSMLRVLHRGQNHSEVARTLYNIGRSHHALGSLRQGLSRFKEALSMLRVLHGVQTHSGVAMTLYAVGLLHQDLGDFGEGFVCLEEVLSMYKALYGDRDHPAIAKTLSALGASHYALGRVYEGLACYEASLSMYRALYGCQKHPDIAIALSNMGLAHERLGNILQAHRHYREAFYILKSVLPAEDPDVQLVRDNVHRLEERLAQTVCSIS